MNSAEVLKLSDSDYYAKNIKSSDIDLFNVVKQVSEITGSSHDVAATALFDCNYDLERAVNKIFENPAQSVVGEYDSASNVWKEVAKSNRKKPLVTETIVACSSSSVEEIVKLGDCNSGSDSVCQENAGGRQGGGRGRGRQRGGRGRLFESNGGVGAASRGRGRRQGGQAGSRGRCKPRYGQECGVGEADFGVPEVDFGVPEERDLRTRLADEWIMDDAEEICEVAATIVTEAAECVNSKLSSLNVNEEESGGGNSLNPVEIVAKYSSKDGVFGDFCRTKAPPPSSIQPTEAIKLLTSAGVMSVPSRTLFNFGLDIEKYCGGVQGEGEEEGCKRPPEAEERPRKAAEDGRRVLGDVEVRRGHKEVPEDSHLEPFSSSLPLAQHTENFTAVLPSSSQLCPPPPGMSNPHTILQQLHTAPQQYISLMNLPGGPQPLFDHPHHHHYAPSSSSDTTQMLHPLDNSSTVAVVNSGISSSSSGGGSKDFMPSKAPSKSVHGDQSTAAVINAMQQLPNICCIPQVYMNSYHHNFMPQHTAALPMQSAPEQSPCSNNNPTVAALSSCSSSLANHHRYQQQQPATASDDFSEASATKYDDVGTAGGTVVSNKHSNKYPRTQNYGLIPSNYGTKDDGNRAVPSSSSTITTVVNRTNQQQQQSVGNDPRMLAALHHHHQQQQQQQSQQQQQHHHPYPNNIYNCVTAPGAHPSGPQSQHAYAAAMSQQLHIMQQQMHNFPQSYPFQEHMMTSMVPNNGGGGGGANNRNGSGTNSNQSTRNNRNALWHPSN